MKFPAKRDVKKDKFGQVAADNIYEFKLDRKLYTRDYRVRDLEVYAQE